MKKVGKEAEAIHGRIDLLKTEDMRMVCPKPHSCEVVIWRSDAVPIAFVDAVLNAIWRGTEKIETLSAQDIRKHGKMLEGLEKELKDLKK